MFNADGLYEITIENDGDAVEDITFQFRFTNTSEATASTVGGKAVKDPLIDGGVIAGVNPAALNVRETFTVDIVCGSSRKARSSVTHLVGGASVFDKPVDNIGDKVLLPDSRYRPGDRRPHHRQPAPRTPAGRRNADGAGQGHTQRRRLDAGVTPGHAPGQ